jgi:hypothetical protein
VKPAFADACGSLDAALNGPARAAILGALPQGGDLRRSLLALRDGMRTHRWRAGGAPLRFDNFVELFDLRTRADGFHVLHDWDGLADRVNADAIPVDMLTFLINQRGASPADRAVAAILLDYYFFYLLTLLSMRVWDDGDPDANLDALTSLVHALQGPHGSGQKFVDDAASLFLIVGSHYEPREEGFDRLLDRVRGLDARHRLRIAIGHAASLGSHLRFGFEATYGRDVTRMRDDNVVDYPWLCFSLVTLLREYDALVAQGAGDDTSAPIVEAFLNGLTADVDAMVGATAPASLAGHHAERAELVDLFSRHRVAIAAASDRHRPLDRAYSPLSFYFNFCQNVLKGIVADALLWGEAWNLTLDDLLRAVPEGDPRGEARTNCAVMLMRYAKANPDPIRGRLMPAIVYDPATGRRAYADAVRRFADKPGGRSTGVPGVTEVSGGFGEEP